MSKPQTYTQQLSCEHCQPRLSHVLSQLRSTSALIKLITTVSVLQHCAPDRLPTKTVCVVLFSASCYHCASGPLGVAAGQNHSSCLNLSLKYWPQTEAGKKESRD